MLLSIKNCGAGVNKDLLPSELAPGLWSDSLNVRFSNGFAERRKGIQPAWTTPAVTPYYLETYNTSTARFLIQAGTAKVYADDGTTQTEITRFGDGAVISSITRVGTTATLTTSTSHGRSTGNTVIVYGATPTQYNGTYVITVTGATTFTYVMASDPGASASPVGAYSTNATSDFTGARDDRWTGGVLNGVLILNNPVNGLYYWNGDPTTRLRKMPGYTGTASCVRVFKNYLVFLDGFNVSWSNAAEPGAVPTQFTSTATNDAGTQPLAETAGKMIDCLPWGDSSIIYTQDARYAMSYIGGNFVFQFRRLPPGGDGLLARGCIANTPKGQVFLSNGDVKIHSGGEAVSLAEGRIRKWLFSTMDSTNAQRSFVCLNPQKCEVWIVFPSYGQTNCDTVVAWNWIDSTWAIFSISSLTYGTAGLIATGLNAGTWTSDTDSWESDDSTWSENEYSDNESRLILSTSTPKIGLADTGTTDFGTSITWSLEKTGIALDDPDSVKVISATRPQVDSISGTAFSVQHGTSMTADSTPTYSNAITYTVGTSNWANAFSTAGRFAAVKYSGTQYARISFRSFDIDLKKRGRF